MVVLRIIDKQEKNFFKRFYYTAFPNKPIKKRIEFEGVFIKYITYYNKGNRVPLKKIFSLVDGDENCVMSANKITFPNHCNLNSSVNKDFIKLSFINAVINLLKDAKLSPQSIRICLYDKKGENQELTQKLIEFSSEIKVITDNVRGYIRQSEKLFESFGVSILINNRFNTGNHLNIIIAPEKIEEKLNLSPNSIVFTSQCPSVELGAKVYFGYRLKVPQLYKVLIPDEIDDNSFIAAFYQESNLTKLTKLPLEYLISNNMYIGRNDVIKQLRKLTNC